MSATPDTPEQLLQLYPYQRRYLHDESRLGIAMFARQTGKTFTSCAAITRDVAVAEAAGRRTRWVILSRGERQAKEAMLEHIQPQTRALMRLYEGLDQPAEPEEVEVRDDTDPRIVYRGLETEWPGGSRVTALPANPSTARGFSANVLLDEFAFHQDSAAIWRALYPVVSKPGLKLRVVSTPNGRQNMFYRLWHAGEPWSHHRCTLGEAIAQGLDRDEDELRRGAADDLLCRQEFDLEFLDEAGQWLTLSDLAACEDELAGQPEHYAGGSTWIGVDIARRRDLYVVVALEQVGQDLWLREIEAHRDLPFIEQDRILDRMIRRYKPVRIAMDQTGMGERSVEEAQRRHGALRVEGVLLTSPRRLDVATALREAVQDHVMRIPPDPLLRDDLYAIKAVSSATGAPRLIDEGDTDGHSDRFWAIALAIASARSGTREYDYTPVSVLAARPERDRMRMHADEDLYDDVPDSERPLFGPGTW